MTILILDPATLFYASPSRPSPNDALDWTRHILNTNLLVLITRSKSSFRYLLNNIILCNSQNLYLVIVSNNCSLLSAIHPFALFILWASFTSKQKRIVSMMNTDAVT